MGFSDNVYYHEHWDCQGNCVVSPTPHYTSQRAPGVVQSLFAHEALVEHVAYTLGMEHDVVQVGHPPWLHAGPLRTRGSLPCREQC